MMIRWRLQSDYSDVELKVIGEPVELSCANALADQNKYQFQLGDSLWLATGLQQLVFVIWLLIPCGLPQGSSLVGIIAYRYKTLW